MDKSELRDFLRQAVKACPDVLPLMSYEARYLLSEPTPYKTFEFFLSAIQGLVHGVYYNHIGGIFIDTLANLISGQLTDAYWRAWADEGHFSELPPYLQEALESMILDQYNYVDRFYRDIVDARIDGTPIEPLLMRANMWANRYQEAYDNALHLIILENGGKEIWVMGQTEQHCTTCFRLNGIVAYAREWEELGVHPQGGPNPLLACGGWLCDCRREKTDQRRSPRAFDTIMNIVST